MLYSFRLVSDELKNWHTVRLNDGRRIYELIARPGQSEHVYMNLPVSRRPKIEVPFPCTVEELSFGESEYMSPEQTHLNTALDSETGIPFRRGARGVPRHLVVSFPHFKGQGGWPAPYTVLNAESVDINNCAFLSFQDPHFHLGSYLLSDNHGHDPKPTVERIIRNELERFSLDDSSLTILGASKGAATAVMMSEYFTAKQLIVCSLSTNLDIPIRKSRYSHIGVALDYYGVSYPDMMECLLAEAAKKETHWFYAVGDHASNQGNESATADRLTSYPVESGHSQVLGESMTTINRIIGERMA